MFDDKTEVIAHFIGIFELATEEARLKIQYQELSALLTDAPDFNPLLDIDVTVNVGYDLQGFHPDLNGFNGSVAIGNATAAAQVPAFTGFSSLSGGTSFPGPDLGLQNRTNIANTAEQPVFDLPPPAQLGTVTAQVNVLEDLDVLITQSFGVSFLSAADFNAGLNTLQAIADDLQPLAAPAPAQSEADIYESGLTIARELQALRADDAPRAEVEGAFIEVAFAEELAPTTVNGRAAETLPELETLSHRFAAEAQEPEDDRVEERAEGSLSNPAQSASGESQSDADLAPDTHEVTAGSNVLVNQSSIVTNWLDAPVIAVGGQSIEVDIISQINVVSDIDTINGVSPAASEATETSQSYNGAQITYQTTSRPDEGDESEEPGSGPSQLAVVTIEGNLLNYNHVQQFNFASDGDVLSIGFAANSTVIQTGENTLINSASVFGLGFHYDLILVEGDIVDLSFLSQTNVLFDNDWVTHTPEFEGTLSTSDNLLLNTASISNVGLNTHTEITDPFVQTIDSFADGGRDVSALREEEAFSDLDVLRVLHVEGHIFNTQVVQQHNVLGDGDQVAFAAQTLQESDGANVSITTGQNELLNFASIVDAGLDSTIYTSEGAYTDAFLHQADFVSEADPLMLASQEGLANEAFLFLADGLLEPEHDEDAGIFAPQPGETAVDVMQTLLA